MAIVLEEALKSAAIYQRSNQLHKAQLIYRQILEQQTDQLEALLGLAMVSQTSKQYRAAELLANQVLEKDPNSLQAWFILGNLYQFQKRFEDAEAAYRRALALNPNVFLIYNNLGYVLQQQEQWEQATHCYQRALELEPRCTEAEVSLAQIKDLTVGLSATEKSDYAALSNNLGFSKKQAGDLDAAIAYYRSALEFSPNLVASTYNLGVALQESHDLAAARTCFETVQQSTADDATPYQAIASEKLKQFSNASKDASKGISKTQTLKVAFVCQPTVMTTFPPFGKPTDSLGILTYELACILAHSCEVTIYVPGHYSQTIHQGNITYVYIPVGLDESLSTVYQDIIEVSDTRPLAASDLYFEGYASAVAQSLQQGTYDIAHVWTFSQFVPIIRQANPELKIILHLEDELFSRLDTELVEPRLESADCVVGCSDYITDKLRSRFANYSHLFHTIYNGANTDIFVDGSIDIAGTHTAVQERPKRLLFVGAVSPEKGAHILLEAFQKVLEVDSNVELTMVGPEYVLPYEFSIACNDDPKVKDLLHFHEGENWRNYVKQYSEKANSSPEGQPPNIRFTGLVPYASLARLYHQADIFIFPSVWNEPFGMPIVEAMIAGTPVIATRGGAFPEIIDSEQTGLLVERGDVASLANGILRLLADDDLRRDLGKQGCHKAIQLFSFQEMANHLEMTYHSLITSGKVSG